MSKIAILKIGTQSFTLPDKADVVTVLKVLNQAQPLDYAFVSNEKVYFPDKRRVEVSVDYIDDAQLRSEPPTKRPASATIAATTLKAEGGDNAS